MLIHRENLKRVWSSLYKMRKGIKITSFEFKEFKVELMKFYIGKYTDYNFKTYYSRSNYMNQKFAKLVEH